MIDMDRLFADVRAREDEMGKCHGPYESTVGYQLVGMLTWYEQDRNPLIFREDPLTRAIRIHSGYGYGHGQLFDAYEAYAKFLIAADQQLAQVARHSRGLMRRRPKAFRGRLHDVKRFLDELRGLAALEEDPWRLEKISYAVLAAESTLRPLLMGCYPSGLSEHLVDYLTR